MKKILIFLLFFSIVFHVLGEKIAEFDDIYKLESFKIDGDDLYVVDGYEIKLFSIKDARLITTFGKRGAGPGEFSDIPRITVFQEDISVVAGRKIFFFKRNGKYISEIKLPLISVSKVKNNYLSNKYIINEKTDEMETEVQVLDNNLKKIRTLYSEKRKLSSIYSKADGKTKKDLFVFKKTKHRSTDGEYIYVYDSNKGFFIEIFDHNGIKLNTIYKEMMQLPVTDQDRNDFMIRQKKSKYWDRLKNRYNFIFSKYFPNIRWLYGDRKNLYVATYKKINEKMEVIILNQKGEILKEAFVPEMEYHLFHKGKYYYFIDNEEDEVWELHMVNL